MHFDILVEHVPTPVDVEPALDFEKWSKMGFVGSITSRCSGKWARTRPDPGDCGNRAYGICCLFENYPFEVFDGKKMDHNQTIVTKIICPKSRFSRNVYPQGFYWGYTLRRNSWKMGTIRALFYWFALVFVVLFYAFCRITYYSGDAHCQVFLPAVLWINTQFFKFPIDLVLYSQKVGPLQLAIHVVQNRRAGDQSRTETRQTKGIQS